MWGARVSLFVGVVAYIIVLLIAIPVGSIAGYFGGWVDNAIMRWVDIVFTIPQVLLVLMFVNWRGPGVSNIFLAIGLIGWVTEARLIRGQFLIAAGTGLYQGIARRRSESVLYHFAAPLPNSLTPMIVAATFGIPSAIFTGSRDQFHRRRHSAAAGKLGSDGGVPATAIRPTDPHMLLFPVLAIGLTMLGFTFLGDGLRDALDPKGNA